MSALVSVTPRHAHLLSNGRYTVMLTPAGSGYSRWGELAVSRWREDPTCDGWGSYVLLSDYVSGAVWSACLQPRGGDLSSVRAALAGTWLTKPSKKSWPWPGYCKLHDDSCGQGAADSAAPLASSGSAADAATNMTSMPTRTMLLGIEPLGHAARQGAA